MKYIKTFENLNQAKSIIAKKMEGYEKLKTLLAKNLGYIGKFTEYLFNENVPYDSLVELYNILLELKSRGQAINISELKYEKVLDTIEKTKNELSVRTLINQFPSDQKNLARELVKKNASNFQLLLKASKIEDISAFISKISRYKSESELKTALQLFSRNRMNSKEKVLEYVNNSKSSKVTLDKGELLIIHVGAFDDMKVLGSDSSWCILGQHMWNTYTKDRFQFIMYDYSLSEFETKFKIGFTLNSNGTIHAAHDILDSGARDYLVGKLTENDISLTSLIPKNELVEVPVNTINSRTTITNLKLWSKNCKLEQIPQFITKVMSYGGFASASKRDILNKLFDRFFLNKTFILESDLKSAVSGASWDSKTQVDVILKNIDVIPILRSKFIDTNKFTTPRNVSEEFIRKKLEIIKDDIIARDINIHQFLGSVYNLTNFRFTIINESLLKTISDKLNKIYESGGIEFKTDFYEIMAVFNAMLNRTNLNSEIEKYITDRTKKRWYMLLNLPIDIDKGIYDFTVNSVKLIEKKQPENRIYLSYHYVHIAEEITKHLKDFNLTFKISIEDVKKILRKRDSFAECTTVLNLLGKFPRSLSRGLSVEEGKIKVVIE